MKNELNLHSMIQAILTVDPNKKLHYRNYDFFIAYGDPIQVKDGKAMGNITFFDYDSPKSFLDGLCRTKLRLSSSEQKRVMEAYNSIVKTL